MNSEQKVLDSLAGSFYITFNMNDTFYFACADSCEMPTGDFITLYPMYEKYGYDLIVAYEAISRDHNPTIQENCTELFFEAKDFLIKNLSKDFCPSLFHKWQELEEEKKMFNGQIIFYKNYKRTLLEKLYALLKRQKYFGVKTIAYLNSGEEAIGFNKYNAKDNLIKKYNKGSV